MFETNERARRLYARLGFREEGRLREEYFHEGRWHTMVRMGIVSSEWGANAEPAIEPEA